MDQRTARLLVKAIRALPEGEQDDVLAALTRAAFGPRAASSDLPPEIGLMSGAPVATEVPFMEPMGPTAMLPVRLPPELHERLRTWSLAHGFSMAGVIRGLVERFLDEQGRPRGATHRAPRTRKSSSTSRKPRPKA